MVSRMEVALVVGCTESVRFRLIYIVNAQARLLWITFRVSAQAGLLRINCRLIIMLGLGLGSASVNYKSKKYHGAMALGTAYFKTV